MMTYWMFVFCNVLAVAKPETLAPTIKASVFILAEIQFFVELSDFDIRISDFQVMSFSDDMLSVL